MTMDDFRAGISKNVASFLESYFDRIIVISISRARERQDKIRKQLQGLNYDFLFGVDKLTLDKDELIAENVYDETAAKKYDRYGKAMLIGQVACALSHRRVYEHILYKGYKRVLIFEDDVVPLFENLEEIPSAFAELPTDWELIYLGYSKYEEVTAGMKVKQGFYKLLSHLRLMKWTPNMVRNMLPRSFSPHLKRAGFHDLLHSYAVTDEACKKLISAQTPVAFVADPLVSHLIMNDQLKAFTTIPQFFTQEQFTDPLYRSLIHH